MKSKKKSRKPKPRIKVAPPSKRHKTEKDYDRKNMGKEVKEALDVLNSETQQALNESIKKCGLDDMLEVDLLGPVPKEALSNVAEPYINKNGKVSVRWIWWGKLLKLFGFKK